VAATVAVYWPVVDFQFTCFDDQGYVYDNSHIKHGLTWDNFAWAATTTEECNWHPMTWWSHMLDCEVYGLGGPGDRHLLGRLGLAEFTLWGGHYYLGGPGGHHLTNLLLHLGSTLLLFLALKRMTGSLWPSAAVAALFAIHPLHVESVAWIAERKDALSGFFWMLTLWLYARYVERPSLGRYAMVFVSLLLGLGAKSMLVTLPLVLLLLDFWPLGRFRRPGRQAGRVHIAAADTQAEACRWPTLHRVAWLVIEKLPLIEIAAVAAAITYYAQQTGGSMGFGGEIEVQTRVANAVTAYGTYLARTVAPIGLSVFYPYVHQIPIWKPLASEAVLITVTALAVWQVRRRPYLAVGWFWFLGTLVPVIGLVQVGAQSMADRYTYVPLIGVFVAVAWLAYELTGGVTWRQFAFGAAAGVAITVLGVFAFIQVGTWKDSVALFRQALAVTENSSLARNNLGVALHAVGERKEAMEHFKKALEIRPDYADAHNNLGMELDYFGQTDQAIEHYHEALRLNPEFPEAEENLGIILYNQGHSAEAIEHYEKAIKYRPDYGDAHFNMGLALGMLDRTEEAAIQFAMSVKENPNDPASRRQAGAALQKLGCYAAAAAEFRELLRLTPDDADARSKLDRAEELVNQFGPGKPVPTPPEPPPASEPTSG
jgi:Tfp pilus assembly protein PilF